MGVKGKVGKGGKGGRGKYVSAAKYWTPLKAAQARKTATQTAAKDLFFHTMRGMIHVFWSFSCLLSQSKKAGNRIALMIVKVIGTGPIHFPGLSATILLLVPISDS
jgi:hypothetical protein